MALFDFFKRKPQPAPVPKPAPAAAPVQARAPAAPVEAPTPAETHDFLPDQTAPACWNAWGMRWRPHAVTAKPASPCCSWTSTASS